jgi:DNA polymerase III subunit beta
MKFIINTDQLLSHLQIVSGALASKPIIPILDHFLFDIREKDLKVSATDLETSITTHTLVESSDNVKIAIPSRMCLETLRSLPNQPVTFDINEENYNIEIMSEFGKYQLIGMSGDDFPRLQEDNSEHSVTVDSTILSSSIARTLFATGVDEIRLAFTGVYVQFMEDRTVFAATDGSKLSEVTRKDVVSAESGTFILPKKALNILKNQLAVDHTDVNVSWNETNAFFKFGDVQLSCRLIDEKYLDYQKAIPQESDNILLLNRREFYNAIRRVAIFSNKSSNLISLQISGSEMIIATQDIDTQNSASERMTCDYTGIDMKIGFNAKYLMEVLNNIDSDQIYLKMSEPNRAGIVLPIENDENEEFLTLVMPLVLPPY